MLQIRRAPAEGLATLLTLVGLLPCVDPLVLSQSCVGAQTFATLLAFVGPFSSVILLVHDAVIAGLERFATLLTLEGLLPSVTHLVPNELGVIPEDFPTFFTFVELHSTPKYQIGIQTESLPRCLAFNIKVLRHVSEKPSHRHSVRLGLLGGFLLYSWLFGLDPGLTTWTDVSQNLCFPGIWAPRCFLSLQLGDQNRFGEWKCYSIKKKKQTS